MYVCVCRRLLGCRWSGLVDLKYFGIWMGVRVGEREREMEKVDKHPRVCCRSLIEACMNRISINVLIRIYNRERNVYGRLQIN